MTEVRFQPPAAKFLKKLKDKKLKALYQEAVDKICENHLVGSEKTGDLSGVYGYDIYYNKMFSEFQRLLITVKNEMHIEGCIGISSPYTNTSQSFNAYLQACFITENNVCNSKCNILTDKEFEQALLYKPLYKKPICKT